MNEDYTNTAKVFVANLSSWVATGTAIRLADISVIVGILAGVGSLTVSIYSIRWIKQQMLSLDKKDHAPRD
jgi:formate hydrogenlyase subunit 3/multisubunit Na+/H+ antiporter MnhD subunit